MMDLKRWLARRIAAAWMAAALGAWVGAAHAAVDANTATPEQLDAIRGIGPALATRIVQERARRPFQDLADLQQRVRGIGPAVARKLAAEGLTVGGAPGAGAAGASGRLSAGGARPGPSAARAVAGSAADGPVVDVPRVGATPIGQGSLAERRSAR